MSVLSLMVATAALVVALTGRHSAPTPDTSTAMAAGDTAAADKALCEAIAPAMADGDKAVNSWLGAGPNGSPERDAVLPRFREATKDWTDRAQSALDAHPDAQWILRKSLQRQIEDQRLLGFTRPGPLPPYMDHIYIDSKAAYAGPLAICTGIGVTW